MTCWMLDHWHELRNKRARMAGIMVRHRVADWWVA